MIDLVLGQATITTTLDLTVPLATDPDTVGVEVPRCGVIPMGAVETIARGCDTQLRRILLDQSTGRALSVGATAYRPHAALTRAVRTRDGTCRFPGCSIPARRCDLDHVVRFPDGPTAEHNLHALCRHHHRLKHDAGWTVTMDAHAVCTWTTPSGVRYVTRPFDYRDIAV
jgi:hypothetical protein